MDVYGTLATDYFRIDDLLDLSNVQDLVSSSSSTPADHHHIPPPENPTVQHLPSPDPSVNPALSSDFTYHLSVPSDEVAELEWLSQFVEDSFSDLPLNSSLTGTINVESDGASFSSSADTKKFKGHPASLEADQPPLVATGRSKAKEMPSKTAKLGVWRCTHCASEKTPQWRMGPLGPKTLCNACGVRYKSGRLVQEYRPAASPTFVLTQHSNSHRKVMELRRQKEMLRQQQDEKLYQQHDFEVC